MGRHHRAEGIEREKARRAAQADGGSAGNRSPAPAPNARAAARTCAWCGSPLYVQPVGRIPKWCSASCRQRAWEQRRAAASGHCAVEVVERPVAVPVERFRMPRHDEWPEVLRELAEQIRSGRVRWRDLPAIGDELPALMVAYRSRRERSRGPNWQAARDRIMITSQQ